MLSNGDIWADNRSPDDSKQFIETYDEINKKKTSQFKEIDKTTPQPVYFYNHRLLKLR
jgi:hypothetical protein